MQPLFIQSRIHFELKNRVTSQRLKWSQTTHSDQEVHRFNYFKESPEWRTAGKTFINLSKSQCMSHPPAPITWLNTWDNTIQLFITVSYDQSNFRFLLAAQHYQHTPQPQCWECNSFKHRILFIFTSRSFSLSASLSAIRFLLSSSSFRASLVSVRSLSSFRIFRIFLRPLRSSPSWSSSPSSPLCGNEHQVWSSDLQPSGKKKKNTSYDKLCPQ